MWARYNNNIVVFLTAGLRKKSSMIVRVPMQAAILLQLYLEYQAAIGRVSPCRPHGRASISNFIYRALDSDVSTGIVMGAAPMTIPVDTSESSAL